MTDETFNPIDAFGLFRSFTRHIAFVREGLMLIQHALEKRALVHDASKLLDDEFAGFVRINAAARINKFGSPEYAESMAQERPVIDLHFSRNSHHAEFYETRPGGMTFLDVIEMVCDWWGARKGYDDRRPWETTLELNFKQKGIYLSPEQIWLARQVADFLALGEAQVR